MKWFTFKLAKSNKTYAYYNTALPSLVNAELRVFAIQETGKEHLNQRLFTAYLLPRASLLQGIWSPSERSSKNAVLIKSFTTQAASIVSTVHRSITNLKQKYRPNLAKSTLYIKDSKYSKQTKQKLPERKIARLCLDFSAIRDNYWSVLNSEQYRACTSLAM